MSTVDLIMPKMGESIIEATILKWVKKEGDPVKEDETILEIATDKVDSEVPSPVDGVMGKILFHEDDVVAVGEVIAQINTGAESAGDHTPLEESASSSDRHSSTIPKTPPFVPGINQSEPATTPQKLEEARPSQSERFYSPLVRNIAAKEKISVQELNVIQGTGINGRVTKKDLIDYIQHKNTPVQKAKVSDPTESYLPPKGQKEELEKVKKIPESPEKEAVVMPIREDNVDIIQMDRMRKLIADHMVHSKRTSAHVTSFVEADVTNMVNWRNQVKEAFKAKHHQNITFTPLFISAVIRAIQDFPKINASVEGDKIIVKHDINVGMATALPSGNLIVPVIKNADYLNLIGLTKKVNNLANRARENKLTLDEIQGGTFTLTNVGTFGNVMGTPIINQPQVAILATGAIRKMPAVLETSEGDVIAIRHKMFLSLSYDHRVVDGYLGGSFLRKVADYLEEFDIKTKI